MIDHYILVKKELGTTKVHLIQYSYGLDSTMDGIGITNEAGLFEYVNHSHVKMYGYTQSELLDAHWSTCYSEPTIDHLTSVAVPALRRDGYWRGEAEGVRKDGTTFSQELVLSQIRGSKKVFCVVRDITEQKQSEDKIKRLALTNEVTSLPNRRSLKHKMAELMIGKVPFFVLFIDVDRFKNVNDSFGHEVGDLLLVQVAERLAAVAHDTLTVFHLGGDEFIALLQMERSEVHQMAAALLEKMGTPFYVSEIEINITISIGISGYPDDHEELEGLISLADTAMYEVKMSGKNDYKWINDEMKAALERKAYVEVELKKAVRHGQLALHYQPILNLESSQAVAVEALLRWNHPKLGPVSPAEFIPIAEETGIITTIGRWVIKEAINQAGVWREAGSPLGVSINVSQRQLSHDKGLVAFINHRLEECRIDPDQVMLEITESVMENYEKIIPVLNELKQLGIKLALDDFGTGFSSLSFVKRLPIDALKIDQSFIREMTESPTDIAIIRSIIEIANNIDLTIVAEGIETTEQVNLLKGMQCLKGQGYLFSKPLPPKALEDWMADKA
ncbi:EAL domain-containing protein [Paenibacillus sp. 1P07SE]|uniref:sensor domain-containing protein n=1 Tax=Paenibacillus sp. 1P07SE TaxID=3132209 RepID=UPI0039A68744